MHGIHEDMSGAAVALGLLLAATRAEQARRTPLLVHALLAVGAGAGAGTGAGSGCGHSDAACGGRAL